MSKKTNKNKISASISSITGKTKAKLGSITSKVKKSKPAKKTGAIRVNQNLSDKRKVKKDLRAKKRAEYLATLPKNPVKRFFYRLHPKRLAQYWFSREGAKKALTIVGVMLLIFTVFSVGVFAYFRKDLPKNITSLDSCKLGQTITIYDRTKTVLLWSGAGDVDCRPVSLTEVSPYLQKAVIATEDQNFYSHHGFDAKALVNAALSNAGSSSGRGGSTITQQYVKLALLTSERTVTRKIKELILAVELDASYKKDEILQAYLNEVGFAYQYNGAEAAARGLFDKSAKDLTIDEAAIMAAGIRSPDYYWVQDQEALVARRDYVLDQMVNTGAITKEEAEQAKQVDTLAKVVKNKNQYKDIKAPHFVLEVYEQIKEKYGKDALKQKFTVVTTLDMNLQTIAEESIRNGFPCQSGQYGIDCLGRFDNAALVSEDVETGQVVALVGSRDFNIPGYGQLDMATTPRSPGSSFKPYDYAALMKSSENWGAGSIMYDLNTDFGGGYRPTDYDGREPGGISMRYALGGSRNIPAIKAMYAAGVNYTHQVAIDLGIKDGITNCAGAPTCADILSTAIGDGGQVRLDQHVHAYGSLARLGKNKPQTYILRVEDSKGKPIYEWKDGEGFFEEEKETQAIDPQIAYIVMDMLSDRNASYFRGSKFYRDRVTNNFEALDIPAAMKTGTTNNFDNGWLLGSTTKYATGVWIGNHENKSSIGRGYENATAPIWGEYMRRAHEALPAKPGGWVAPEGIKTVAHDAAYFATIKSKCTGAQLGNVCGFGQSDIYPSWYSPKKTNAGQKAIIDTVSNRLATECTPERAKKEITSGNIQPEIPNSDPNYSRWLAPIQARYGGVAGGSIPTEKDNVHNCGDVKPTVSISGPSSCSGYCEYTVSYTSGTHAIKTLNMKVNGQIVTSYEISPGGGDITFEYTPTFSGDGTVEAEVIDVALYDSVDRKTATFAQAGSLTLTGNEQGFNDYRLSWTPDIDAADCYEITRESTVIYPCSTNNTYLVNGPVPSGTKFVVKAKTTGGTVLATSNELVK